MSNGAAKDHVEHLRWALLASGARTANRLGVARQLQTRRTRWDSQRAGDEWWATIAELPAAFGSTGSASLAQSLRPVATLCDVSVAILARTDDRPGTVIKVARSEEAAGELRTQRDVLEALDANAALGEWRGLLPRVLHLEDRRQGAPLLEVETLLPGTTLEARLTTSPERLETILGPALETIAVLHERTGTITTIEPVHLNSWVDAPLEWLRRACRRLAPASTDAVSRLGGELHDSLLGRRARVSWTHGDFTPGNVLLGETPRCVSGIVDWAGGRPDHLAAIDQHMMLLAASSLRRRQELGAVVTDRLANTARHERGVFPPLPQADVLDDRALTLLTWLRHVAEMQRKSVRYRTHRVWWALNVEPVLWAIGGRLARRTTTDPLTARTSP